MGIYIRDEKKGKKIYYIRCKVNGKIVIKSSYSTIRRDAEILLGKIKKEIAEGRYVKKSKPIRFFELTDIYFNRHSKNHKKSWRRDSTSIKQLKRFFGDVNIQEITPAKIEEYITKRLNDDKVTNATVNRDLTCLKTMFNKAKIWNYTQDNPMDKVKMLKETNRKVVFLEWGKIKKLLEECERSKAGKYLTPIVILALNTGMRKAEILKLKWSDIDFKLKIISILDTKNGEISYIEINKWVMDKLIKVEKHPDSPYIFCNKDGNPYGNIRRSFNSVVKKAGIKNFRFHDLRHTFASHLVMGGFPLVAVQKLMRHKSIEMTMRYAHLSPNCSRKAVEWLADEFQKQIGSTKSDTVGQLKENELVRDIHNYKKINNLSNLPL